VSDCFGASINLILFSFGQQINIDRMTALSPDAAVEVVSDKQSALEPKRKLDPKIKMDEKILPKRTTIER
jgi:hypothetical protein